MLEELRQNEEISIVTVMDRDVSKKLDNELVVHEGKIIGVDLIVITAIHSFEEIKEGLYYERDCRVVCIDDLLYEIVR